MKIVAPSSLPNNFMYQVFSCFFSVSYISRTLLAYQFQGYVDYNKWYTLTSVSRWWYCHCLKFSHMVSEDCLIHFVTPTTMYIGPLWCAITFCLLWNFLPVHLDSPQMFRVPRFQKPCQWQRIMTIIHPLSIPFVKQRSTVSQKYCCCFQGALWNEEWFQNCLLSSIPVYYDEP
jgi:hypothetical protein